MMSNIPLPNLAQVLGPVLQNMRVEHQPLFIALAERQAAERYRTWANSTAAAAHKAALLACADREEEIALSVESLYPEAASIQKTLLNDNPSFADASRSLFAPFSMSDQFVLQAQGERLGAATWRAFAKRATDTKSSDVFLHCATLEEQSAEFLESIGAGRSG